jgi:uncharacterized membrane protein YhaH (DUF805 family)
MNQSSERAPRRFRAFPAAGWLALLVGVVLIAVGLITDNSLIAYSGWLILIASALLVVIGMIARGAEKRGRDDARKDEG